MKLEFVFERGGTIKASVDPQAKETIRCVQAVLPIKATVFQARWSGREIFIPLKLPIKPSRERQSIRASIGDVIYFCEWGEQYDYTGFESIGMFYGPEIVREWRGDAPVNVFARMDPDNYDLIKEIGERVWRKGSEGVAIRIAAP